MADKTMYILSQPFDIETHKKHFKNYLEVIIDENATVHYAIHSHQEWLIRYAMKMLNLTREELSEQVPREYWLDMITWWTKLTKCVSVWNNFYEGSLNPHGNSIYFFRKKV